MNEDDIPLAETPEEAAEKLMQLTGAEPGETIKLTTPQFERLDGIEPDEPPLTEVEFNKLKELSVGQLQRMGLRKWSDDTGLMLLPHEWYPHIPEGVELKTIWYGDEDDGITGPHDKIIEFDRDEHGDDKRFGVLSYGIIPEEANDDKQRSLTDE